MIEKSIQDLKIQAHFPQVPIPFFLFSSLNYHIMKFISNTAVSPNKFTNFFILKTIYVSNYS